MRRLLAALLALSLAACATVQRYDAAGDVHALMVSIRDDDRAVFDAHVDRTALKAQLRARLMAGAIGRGDAAGWGGVLGVIVGGPLIDGLVDALVQPPVFLAIAEAHGYSPSRPLPSRTVIAAALRPLDDGRVCLPTKRDGPCALIFRDEDGVWRLVAFEGDPGMLIKPKR